jgi:hypothetical protein
MIVHEEMHEVRLHGWREGALKISATDAIRENTKMGLAEAKGVIDRCLEGKTTIFTFDSLDQAMHFSTVLNRVGFISEVIKSDTGLRIPEK